MTEGADGEPVASTKTRQGSRGLRLYGLVLVGSMIGCLVGGWLYLRYQNIEFAHRATGLPLSAFDSMLICDDSDMTLGYHMHAGRDLRREVTARRTVVEWPRAELTLSEFVNQECLPAASDATAMIYSAGCSEHQAWIALLDPDTGDLWLEVRFPDFSGDVPGCPPGTER